MKKIKIILLVVMLTTVSHAAIFDIQDGEYVSITRSRGLGTLYGIVDRGIFDSPRSDRFVRINKFKQFSQATSDNVNCSHEYTIYSEKEVPTGRYRRVCNPSFDNRVGVFGTVTTICPREPIYRTVRDNQVTRRNWNALRAELEGLLIASGDITQVTFLSKEQFLDQMMAGKDLIGTNANQVTHRECIL